MRKNEEKYITWAKQRRAYKENKRWKAIKRKHNIQRNSPKKYYMSEDAHFSPIREEIVLPADCKFINHFEELIAIVNSIKFKVDSPDSLITHIYLDMSAVIDIDSASINIILSLAHYLTRIGIFVSGVLPNDEQANEKIVKSGFLKLVKTKRKVPETTDHISTLTGNDKTDQEAIGDEIRNICNNLLGKNQPYPPLYDTLGEIAANSVEHANTEIKDKNWFMSVHYDRDYAVIQMADIGDGILGTLKLLLKQEIFKNISLQSPHETLKKLFQGKYQSCTLEPNRNNGLPDMLERYNENYIDNVIVVSNNAVYDFSDSLSRTLNNPFPGTFYSIRITKQNIEKWQNRIL